MTLGIALFVAVTVLVVVGSVLIYRSSTRLDEVMDPRHTAGVADPLFVEQPEEVIGTGWLMRSEERVAWRRHPIVVDHRLGADEAGVCCSFVMVQRSRGHKAPTRKTDVCVIQHPSWNWPGVVLFPGPGRAASFAKSHLAPGPGMVEELGDPVLDRIWMAVGDHADGPARLATSPAARAMATVASPFLIGRPARQMKLEVPAGDREMWKRVQAIEFRERRVMLSVTRATNSGDILACGRELLRAGTQGAG